jgi:hypothetical protein
MSLETFRAMADTFLRWNSEDSRRYNQGETWSYKRSKISTVAMALGDAINRCMQAKFLPCLRQMFKAISLTPASRGVMLALIRHASPRDIQQLLERIAQTRYELDIWNHTELGLAASKRLEACSTGISTPTFLKDIMKKREFWEYISSTQRKTTPTSELLPLEAVGNKGLYVRLTAYSAIGSAGLEELEALLKLSQHYFGLVARCAAMRAVRLAGESALRKLRLMVDECLERGTAESLADSIRYAEMEFYGLATYR